MYETQEVVSPDLQGRFDYGSAKELHALATNLGKIIPQRAKFTGPTWGPPGSCRPQMGPMLGP